jgi:hypothetical protein
VYHQSTSRHAARHFSDQDGQDIGISRLNPGNAWHRVDQCKRPSPLQKEKMHGITAPPDLDARFGPVGSPSSSGTLLFESVIRNIALRGYIELPPPPSIHFSSVFLEGSRKFLWFSSVLASLGLYKVVP